MPEACWPGTWEMQSQGPQQSIPLSVPHCPSPRTKGSVHPKARKSAKGRGGVLATAAPGSLAQTPPRLSPSALGWGWGRGKGPHPELQEPARHLDTPCSRSRLVGSEGGKLAAHKPGPGSEMGQETRMGMSGSRPQGGDHGAAETEITAGNKQASPRNGSVQVRQACAWPCVYVHRSGGVCTGRS